MESNSTLKKLMIISSFFFFINNAIAICLPRGSDYLSPNPSTDPLSQAPSPSPTIQSPTIQSPPPHAPSKQTPGPTSQTDNSASSMSTTVHPELNAICSKTDYAPLCLSTIIPFFNGKTDVFSVLQMAIQATTQQAKLAISAATELSSIVNISRDMATILQDCSDNYSDAIDNLQTAMDSIKTRDIGTINSMLSAVVTDSWTCDDEFTGNNPMAVYEEKLGNMASNCLAIASLIK